jgi:tetratricopeptide (TPR) repeat protein
VAIAAEHLSLFPDDTRALYMGANGLVGIGRRDEGLEWAQRALALEPEEPMLVYNIGCIYALAGERDAALDCLERAAFSGLSQREWYLHDTNLDSLRGEPRFDRLMQALAKPSELKTAGV